ncbi:MAG: membrane dipeptidase [Candidatus Parvarchaeota archaeon]
MGSNKKYSGYKSFAYLEPGKDFKTFELSKEIGRVEPFVYPISKDEEDRVQSLLEKYILISLHDHSHVHPANIDQVLDQIRTGRVPIGYEGLAASHLDAIFDGLLDGTNRIRSNVPWQWDSLIYELGLKLSDLKHQDFAILGERVEDIYRAHKEGKVAYIPHIEGAMPIENDLDRVDILYGFGVRMMGLVYSESNNIGSGLSEKNDAGLTEFGYRVVERMNKLGMAIDVAHTGDKTALDAIEASKVPIFVSHSGARALWNTRRMKPDSVIQALAEKGGVFGVEAAPHTTLTHKNRQHSIEGVMEHFQYIENLVGIDYVTFGPDTLFGDHVGIHHLFSKELSIGKSHEGESFEEVPYVKGLENLSEYPNIVRWLVKNGYSNDEIEKVVGGNTLRVLKTVWR